MRFLVVGLLLLSGSVATAGDGKCCKKSRCLKPFKMVSFKRSVCRSKQVKADCCKKKVEKSKRVKRSLKIGSYQLEAERQVKYMAERNIKGHVMQTIGDFEGVGWSSSGTPDTCKPRCFGSASCSFELVADAQFTNKNGTFRLRSWVKK